MHSSTSVSGSSASSPAAPSKHGFYHSIRRFFQKQPPSARFEDGQFDTLLHNFYQYIHQVEVCKNEAKNYTNSVIQLFNHANNLTTSLSSILYEQNSIHSYTTLANSTNQAHITLIQHISTTLTNHMNNNILIPLTDINNKCEIIHKNLQQHTEFHSEYTYYKVKYDHLIEQKEHNRVSGVADSQKFIERFDRNTVKFHNAEQLFKSLHSLLSTELNDLWTNRITTLGPILHAFVSMEKEISTAYLATLQNIDTTIEIKETPTMVVSSTVTTVTPAGTVTSTPVSSVTSTPSGSIAVPANTSTPMAPVTMQSTVSYSPVAAPAPAPAPTLASTPVQLSSPPASTQAQTSTVSSTPPSSVPDGVQYQHPPYITNLTPAPAPAPAPPSPAPSTTSLPSTQLYESKNEQKQNEHFKVDRPIIDTRQSVGFGSINTYSPPQTTTTLATATDQPHLSLAQLNKQEEKQWSEMKQEIH